MSCSFTDALPISQCNVYILELRSSVQLYYIAVLFEQKESETLKFHSLEK